MYIIKLKKLVFNNYIKYIWKAFNNILMKISTITLIQKTSNMAMEYS